MKVILALNFCRLLGGYRCNDFRWWPMSAMLALAAPGSDRPLASASELIPENLRLSPQPSDRSRWSSGHLIDGMVDDRLRYLETAQSSYSKVRTQPQATFDFSSSAVQRDRSPALAG